MIRSPLPAGQVSLWTVFWLGLCLSARAVSSLVPGDLAIVGFNADGIDDFSFVTFAELDGGGSIVFADNNGTITYTAPGGGLPAGHVVVITNASSTGIGATLGVAVRSAGDYDYSASGDRLEVLQGSTHLYAAETLSVYAPPAGLSAAGGTWVSHPDAKDNGVYTGARVGSPRGLLMEIADVANWVYTDGSGNQAIDLNAAPHNTPFSVLPAVSFPQTSLSVAENTGTAAVSIVIDRAPAVNATVQYATVIGTAIPGRDFTATSGTLAWSGGDASGRVVEIPITDNADREGPTFFSVFLSSPLNCGVQGSALATVTILDDEAAAPLVTNGGGPTDIAARAATLRGSVISTGSFADVTLFWGAEDGGTNRAAWSNAVALGVQEGDFVARVEGLIPNTIYRYRTFASNLAGVAWAPATTSFTTLAAADYYVNDTSREDDVYTTAVGSDANNGTAPGTPKATVQAILDAYDLGPGDAVFIDTGVYALAAALTITDQDAGAEGNCVVFKGSRAGAGALLDRGGSITDDAIRINVAGDTYVRLEDLKVTGGKNGIHVSGTALNASAGVQLVRCEVYGNTYLFGEGGILLKYCAQALVSECVLHDNATQADINLAYCRDAAVRNNACRDNSWGYGIWLSGCETCTVTGNDAHGYSNGYGINLTWGHAETVESNMAYNAAFSGINAYNSTATRISGNRAFNNGLHGIHVNWDGVGDPAARGPATTGNRVFGNGGAGMLDHCLGNGHTIAGNVVFNNGAGTANFNIALTRSDVPVRIENNTVYGGRGIYFARPGPTTNRNNIIWATGAGNAGLWVQTLPADPASFRSDYNNLYATDGAALGRWAAPEPDGTVATSLSQWRAAAGADSNSISLDPLFVDGTGGDFHIMSAGGSYHEGAWLADATNSPCIDAGDPWAEFGAEPPFNGLRVNLGAYGNGARASRTAYNGPFHTLQLAAVPPEAGDALAWPPALAYPHAAAVTAWAALTNGDFRWDHWEGDLGGAAPTQVFNILGNMSVRAVFEGATSNTYGIPGWWFALYDLPPTQEGAEADSDADGLFNWAEYYAGTIPTNAASVLRVQALGSAGEHHVISFLSVTGKTYRPQSTPSLATGAWSNEAWSATPEGALVDQPVPGVDGSCTLHVATGGPSRCYRILLEPAP